MENQDKLYNQFKDAAAKAEDKGFARMDAVWNRVEEKLDNDRHRKAAAWWKYTGIAASFLLFMTVGFFMLQDNKNTITAPDGVPQNTITTKEAESDVITTAIDTAKIEQVLGTSSASGVVSHEGTPTVAGDSISFISVSKKTRVWKSVTDIGEFRVKAERTTVEPYADSPNYESFKAKEVVIPQTVTGVVSDDAGPLPGATIIVKGTNRAAVTDMDGNYSIVVTDGETLQYSYAGYNPVEIGTTKGSTINATLGAQTLSAVQTDVYRKMTPDKSTASVTTISAEDIEDRCPSGILSLQSQIQAAGVTIDNVNYDILSNGSIQNRPLPGNVVASQYAATAETRNRNLRDGDKQSKSYDEKAVYDTTITEEIGSNALEHRANTDILKSLQGKVAGLEIVNGSGQPGADSTIILRGVGTIDGNVEPLFIVDGVPVDEDGFRSIDQNDIADIQVFKNAAASSIYGSRGANGVILITTRKTSLPPERDILDRDKNVRDAMGIYQYHENAPVILLNGREAKSREFKNLKDEEIESVILLKDDSATRFYGEAGEHGVIIIKTKDPEGKKKETFRQLDQKLKRLGQDGYIEIKYGEIPKIPVSGEEDYESFQENQFENPAVSPLSTFSIDVDNASYTNVRRFLNSGQSVPKDAVRVEEMINFFKYDYPQPTGNDPFSINTEYSDAPWNPNHKLLKIGLQGKIIPETSLSASNFVFLIDVSGSMDEPNKLPLLKQSMKVLASQIRKEDRIAIVVYAGAAGLVLPSTPGDEKQAIYNALDNLSAGGSTAGGAGIELAYKIAGENFLKGGNNRVILATDGDFNVGASSNTDMQTLIEEKRKSGVFLTCLGYGMGNYKDSKLETLADKGNGNYAYIDNMQEADRFLNREFEGSMYAIAKDVKIQIEFNPKHVQSYRLIGYENRKLRDEDFTNDAIDAGELGSGHTVTALYEIIPVGAESSFFTPAPELKYSQPTDSAATYSDELATIKFRHKKPDADTSTATVNIIPNITVPLQNASGDFKFSAAVAWFGLKLRDSKLVQDKTSENIIKLAKEGLLNDLEGYRSEFIRLVNMVK